MTIYQYIEKYGRTGTALLEMCRSHETVRQLIPDGGMLVECGDMAEEEIIHTQARWQNCRAKKIFRELYYRSGIRPEAVQKNQLRKG